jgi:hypothetical protein
VLSPVHFVLSPWDPFHAVSTVGWDAADDWVRRNLNGYGFASAWRRRVAEAVRFPDGDLGEDADFVERVVNAGFQAGYAADAEGLVLHVIHQNNVSRACPQALLSGLLTSTDRTVRGKGFQGLRVHAVAVRLFMSEHHPRVLHVHRGGTPRSQEDAPGPVEGRRKRLQQVPAHAGASSSGRRLLSGVCRGSHRGL